MAELGDLSIGDVFNAAAAGEYDAPGPAPAGAPPTAAPTPGQEAPGAVTPVEAAPVGTPPEPSEQTPAVEWSEITLPDGTVLTRDQWQALQTGAEELKSARDQVRQLEGRIGLDYIPASPEGLIDFMRNPRNQEITVQFAQALEQMFPSEEVAGGNGQAPQFDGETVDLSTMTVEQMAQLIDSRVAAQTARQAEAQRIEDHNARMDADAQTWLEKNPEIAADVPSFLKFMDDFEVDGARVGLPENLHWGVVKQLRDRQADITAAEERGAARAREEMQRLGTAAPTQSAAQTTPTIENPRTVAEVFDAAIMAAQG